VANLRVTAAVVSVANGAVVGEVQTGFALNFRRIRDRIFCVARVAGVAIFLALRAIAASRALGCARALRPSCKMLTAAATSNPSATTRRRRKIVPRFITKSLLRLEDQRYKVSSRHVLVMVAFWMLGVPGADSGANNDCIFIRRHGVLHARWNVEEASYRVGFEVLQVECFAEADPQHALNHCNPRVAAVGVKIMKSRGNESRVGERFAWYVAPPFKHRPFGPIAIDFLPGN